MLSFNVKNIIKQVLFLWIFWIIIRLTLTSSGDHLELFLVQNIYTLVSIIIIVSINVKYLIPKFFINKKYIFFILGSSLLLCSALFIVYSNVFPWGYWYQTYSNSVYLEIKPYLTPNQVKWLPRLAPLIIAFLGSSVVEVMQYANKKENEFIEAEKEKLKTELKFLKSQVNPHFLFNALNNIYSLSVTQSVQTSESIMQLSEILRYMVYDSREAKVPLNSEINYIKNFIELIKLKDSRGLAIEVEMENEDSSLLIAPLLFIPFIENAFKHSKIESLNNGFVVIQLKVNKKSVELKVVNSIPENNFTKDDVGGIGLENTKKRLSLLYPDEQHQLKIVTTAERFEVLLNIETS